MLLRRVIEHVKNQNWTAVALDFVIVVVGVFIGIQVSNWNAARQDIAEERAYLLRMRVDLDQSIQRMTDENILLKTWQENGEKTLRAIISNDPDAVSEFDGFELQASTRISLGTPQMATINELISGGRVNIIRNAEIRENVAMLDARLNSLRDLNGILVDYAAEIAPIIQGKLLPEWTENGNLSAKYEFAELSQDQEFQNALGFALRLQSNNYAWTEQMIDELKALRKLIAIELDEPIEFSGQEQ